MRQLIILAPLLFASPVLAQDGVDHSTHSQTAEHDTHDAHTSHKTPATMDDDAMDHSVMDHGAMDHGTMDASQMNNEVGPPPGAFGGPRHAADPVYGERAMAPARDQLAKEMGEIVTGRILIERLEARVREGSDAYLWDAEGYYGGDIDKLWVKTEGEGAFGEPIESAEVQALWSHAIGPWFDVQAGARYDLEPDERTYAVLGVQGLAPYMFHIDAAAFLSDRGDLTARIEGEYDQRITQRLILQPRAELELSAQDVAEQGLATGLTSIEAGLRLRYEIRPELAPYVGVGYESLLGDTADSARTAGKDADSISVLFGIRVWF